MENVTGRYVDMRIRQWRKLKYRSCVEILAAWDATLLLVDWDKVPERERRLRESSQKPMRELIHAAVLAWGLSCRLGSEPIAIAQTDTADHDAIFVRREGPTKICYSPVQLKEFVPEYVSTSGTLQDILNGLPRKYPNSPDLIVAILHGRANVNEKLEFIIPENLRIGGLHIFGSCSPNGEKWFVTGDLTKGQYAVTEFFWPGRG